MYYWYYQTYLLDVVSQKEKMLYPKKKKCEYYRITQKLFKFNFMKYQIFIYFWSIGV